MVLIEQFQGIAIVFSCHQGPEPTARWTNDRSMPSLSMCFPITNAETEETNTEQARGHGTDWKTDTGGNFMYDEVSTSLSSNRRAMMWSWVPRFSVSSDPVSSKLGMVWVSPQCTAPLPNGSKFYGNLGGYSPCTLAVIFLGPSSRGHDVHPGALCEPTQA